MKLIIIDYKIKINQNIFVSISLKKNHIWFENIIIFVLQILILNFLENK